jgi:hypothetical protein
MPTESLSDAVIATVSALKQSDSLILTFLSPENVDMVCKRWSYCTAINYGTISADDECCTVCWAQHGAAVAPQLGVTPACV